ncbi:MAG TPA: CYTH domain-containing protein [Phaeodactylibacter sp.]|nr:CYTH domain-containing protein [Phaeodactylibacter sp.]
MALNIEIKARCKNPDTIKKILEEQGADFRGIDHQIDTYFKVSNGRLKLREGNIEHSLIQYHRPNQAGPKKSDYILYHPQPNSSLKELLTKANGVLVVVDKFRSIYCIDNVKFHVDEVKDLGSFMEIEVIDMEDSKDEKKLLAQCQHYMSLLDISDNDLIKNSYSDLILEQ